MRAPRIRLNESTILILVVCSSFLASRDATAARYVPAKISLDGKLLLEGSTGDDGRVDADGVWDYLKSLKFKATKEFMALGVDPNAKDTILSSKATEGQLGTIVVDITYGGRATRRKLKLIRVPVDKAGREWSLDPLEVEKMFDDRLIRRSDAARLENPQGSKRYIAR